MAGIKYLGLKIGFATPFLAYGLWGFMQEIFTVYAFAAFLLGFAIVWITFMNDSKEKPKKEKE